MSRQIFQLTLRHRKQHACFSVGLCDHKIINLLNVQVGLQRIDLFLAMGQKVFGFPALGKFHERQK